MTVIPANVISIGDDTVVISADAVAPRLGLTPEALQAEMQHGQVYCLVETGVDEDEGRTRVTVRWHARSCTLVIEPDGKRRATTWNAIPFPLKMRAKSPQRDLIAEQLRAWLQNMATAGLTITYGRLAKLLDLSPPNTIHQITGALERMMEEDVEAGRPFLAALAVSKAPGGLPAVGFFDCAKRLGRFTGDANGSDARSFYVGELNAALKFWGAGDNGGCEEGAANALSGERGRHDGRNGP